MKGMAGTLEAVYIVFCGLKKSFESSKYKIIEIGRKR